MKERRSQVLIIEGAQGSGKTTAAEHLSKIGCKLVGGIPSGQELVVNREVENWKQSIDILELVINSSDGSISVMDRSIWSLVAYNIRKKPDHRSLIYDLGKNMFERIMGGKTDYRIVFLESDPETSFSREYGRGTHFHRSVEEVSEEIQIYQWLMGKLERDGFNVVRIRNNGISTEEFLSLVEQSVGAAS
ncbi:hypothetical protein KBI33_02085 [Candidatus Shapirobacteria bacterium]|nr:hypothetical protein [Candidatus Shapirobacteria bacterium]